ncbi:protein of unknown function [Rhodovastum atsumiense]|nr:protein of unknown function [Rhodovastum atsumiense]
MTCLPATLAARPATSPRQVGCPSAQAGLRSLHSAKIRSSNSTFLQSCTAAARLKARRKSGATRKFSGSVRSLDGGLATLPSCLWCLPFLADGSAGAASTASGAGVALSVRRLADRFGVTDSSSERGICLFPVVWRLAITRPPGGVHGNGP